MQCCRPAVKAKSGMGLTKKALLLLRLLRLCTPKNSSFYSDNIAVDPKAVCTEHSESISIQCALEIH